MDEFKVTMIDGDIQDLVFNHNRLLVIDYLTRPIRELMYHPDFNIADFKKAIALSRLTGEEIQLITVPGEVNATD
jgi:hypothetical protein